MKIPMLIGSKIKELKVLGKGQRVSSDKVHKVSIRGVIAARKRIRGYPRRKKAIDAQKTWLVLKKAGLPVPAFSKVDLRGKQKAD